MRSPRLTRFGLPVTILVGVVVVLLAVPTEKGVRAATGASGGGSIEVPAGVTLPAAPGSPGTAVSGISCKPGVRQVTWTAYSPLCVPAYSGNNGGTSYPGVTKTTINMAYRLASSTVLQEIYTLFPKSIVGTNAEAIATYQAYIKIFNRDYELYGRHVVLKAFNGQGNFINELTGTGQEAAQADAVTEKTMPVFVDNSAADSSNLFDSDLAAQGIVTFTQWPIERSWFTSEGDYLYAAAPDYNKDAAAAAAFAGLELSGFPAVFGNSSMTNSPRKLAFIYQATPMGSAYEQAFLDDFGKYHQPQPDLFSYYFDFADLVQEAQTAVAKMKADGVTTVLLTADPISPIFFMEAAQQQNYYPEWVFLSIFDNPELSLDPLGTMPPQAEMAHAFSLGIADGPLADSEAFKVFEMGCKLPPRTDCSNPLPAYSLGVIYSSFVMIYGGLQAAGPWLTPGNFAKGIASLPEGPVSGMFGKWTFGPGTVDPSASFQVLKYYPDRVSPLDSASIAGTPIQPINGGKGVYLACNGGASYLYSKPLLPHRQPSCPGG